MTPNGIEVPIFARVCCRHSNDEFPLLKRAWAYQERLLSRRVLHFAGYELIWECAASYDCECGTTPERDSFRPFIPTRPDETRGYGPDTLQKQWQLTVDNDSDILERHIPGIVRSGENIRNGSFRSLRCGALEKLYDPRPALYRDSDADTLKAILKRAPSWSWASTVSNARVQFLAVFEELATVEDVCVNSAGPDSTGALKPFAYLDLKAKLLRTSINV
jgi:hypothetical protein